MAKGHKRTGTLCFICEEDIENLDYLLLDCPQFKENFDSIWCNLELKIGIQIANFNKKFSPQLYLSDNKSTTVDKW